MWRHPETVSMVTERNGFIVLLRYEYRWFCVLSEWRHTSKADVQLTRTVTDCTQISMRFDKSGKCWSEKKFYVVYGHLRIIFVRNCWSEILYSIFCHFLFLVTTSLPEENAPDIHFWRHTRPSHIVTRLFRPLIEPPKYGCLSPIAHNKCLCGWWGASRSLFVLFSSHQTLICAL